MDRYPEAPKNLGIGAALYWQAGFGEAERSETPRKRKFCFKLLKLDAQTLSNSVEGASRFTNSGNVDVFDVLS